jgi:REP element-mobilizing transposase RayT
VGFLLIFVTHDAIVAAMPKAWNNWYHVTVHTYGSWLRGDPRGWRARHHREHVEGDYKKPPAAGVYDRLHARSQTLMKRDPVQIAHKLRGIVVISVVEKLQEDGVQIIVAAVDSSHLHLLARFDDHRPKHWVGRAKKNASHVLRQQSLRDEEGGLWAKHSYAAPIVDRRHQVKTFQYILAHAQRGAAVWRFDWQK